MQDFPAIQDQPAELRSAHRRKLLKRATISPDRKDIVFDCTLRNISQFGARLRVVSQIDIPDTFQLMCAELDVDSPAQIIWRKGDELGVALGV